MSTEEIRAELFRLQDKDYREFQGGLLPTVSKEKLVGVRTPALRQYAKELVKREDTTDFLNDLPHFYFDENQLHAFILCEMKDPDRCFAEVDRFLPFVDNWATCDQLSPRVFGKQKETLLLYVDRWLASGETYTVRFAVGMLMAHFLDADFSPVYPDKVAAIRSDEYYVNMMVAWYFATALAKQYAAVLPYLENKRLEKWTHNKAIQKATESRRLTPEQKTYLKSLKLSGK